MVDEAQKHSVQARARGEIESHSSILQWLTVAGNIIAPWWSTARDAELRRFWKQVDHIAGACSTFQSRLITIPFKVVPRDMSFKSHQRQADKFTEMLLDCFSIGVVPIYWGCNSIGLFFDPDVIIAVSNMDQL